MLPWILSASVLLIVVLAALCAGPFRRWRRSETMRRAKQEFHYQRERLEAKFLDCAAASGKPRGLRWVECDWDKEPIFVRARSENKLAAFVGVTIRFQAIEGGGMEDVPAVKNLRTATGVFHYERGRWMTMGKALFNLEPTQAVTRFKDQFEPVAPPAT